jgi:hypothetical protein
MEGFVRNTRVRSNSKGARPRKSHWFVAGWATPIAHSRLALNLVLYGRRAQPGAQGLTSVQIQIAAFNAA